MVVALKAFKGDDSRTEQAVTTIQTDKVNEFDGRLEYGHNNYATYRLMRNDPTVALAREVSIAPILSSSWGYESDEGLDDQRDFIKWQMDSLRRGFLRVALLGQIDFGWKGFEKVFGTIRHREHGMRIVLDKLKPLKNDYTYALYGIQSGDFGGLVQDDPHSNETVHIDTAHSLFVNFDDEGVNDYASPLMEKIREPYKQWNDTNEAACRYDTKVAGSHWVVYYPVGKSTYNDDLDVDNGVIAKKVLATLKSSGSVCVPVNVGSVLDDLGGKGNGWSIELVSDAGKSSDFLTRLKYLDSLKVRGMMITERSIMEGTFGTKAEAEAHFNASQMIMQLRHETITDHLNKFVVNQLLRHNYGVEDTVRLVANPLVDEKIVLFKALFTALTTNPASAVDVLDSIQVEEILEVLKIPHTPVDKDETIEVASVEEEPE